MPYLSQTSPQLLALMLFRSTEKDSLHWIIKFSIKTVQRAAICSLLLSYTMLFQTQPLRTTHSQKPESQTNATN